MQANTAELKHLVKIAFFATAACAVIFTWSVYTRENRLPVFLQDFACWDSERFLDIAKSGYSTETPQKSSLIGHFPLYPLLIYLIHFIARDYLASALALSNIFYFLAVYYFYKLMRLDISREAAFRSIFYWSIFPAALVLHLPYAESFYAALVLAGFYYARRNHWALASTLVMLAGATRVVGVILPPVFLVEYFRQKNFSLKRIDRKFGWFFLMPLGILTFLVLSYVLFGNAFEYLHQQDVYWGKRLAFPWEGLSSGFKILNGPYTADQKIFYGYVEIFCGFGLVIFTIYSCLRQRWTYAAYTVLFFLLILCNSQPAATPRYLLMLFPLFIAMGQWSENKLIHLALICACLLGQFFYTYYFVGPVYLAF